MKDSIIHKRLGKNLKILRLRQKEKFQSQVYFGKIMGLHQSAVSRVESGDQYMTPEQLYLLSRRFNFSIDDFVNNDWEEPEES